MKPKCELYLSSFSISFFVAQSSLLSIALVYSRNKHDFFSLSKANPSGLQEIKVSGTLFRSRCCLPGGILLFLF